MGGLSQKQMVFAKTVKGLLPLPRSTVGCDTVQSMGPAQGRARLNKDSRSCELSSKACDMIGKSVSPRNEHSPRSSSQISSTDGSGAAKSMPVSRGCSRKKERAREHMFW